MRILVCGGRDFNSYEAVDMLLSPQHRLHGNLVIIQGGARGADRLAGMWAEYNKCEQEIYPANWDKYGKSAGYIRNKQMIDEGKPDVVIAFPGGRGTADMIRQAETAGIKVIKIEG